jgi:hypothetical protein
MVGRPMVGLAAGLAALIGGDWPVALHGGGFEDIGRQSKVTLGIVYGSH